MKKIIVCLISFLMFIPFMIYAQDNFYYALVTNQEGAVVYTEEYGDIEEVSVLEYNSVINISQIDSSRAKLEGYNEYSFIYLKDVRRIDNLKEIGIEENEEPTNQEIENEKETIIENNNSNIADYIICFIGIIVIIFLLVVSKKVKKNETL